MINLSDIINKHGGESFLVCGMGTSIDQYPRDFYEAWEGVTVGVNEITDLFTPDYLFNVNLLHDKDYNAFWDKGGREIRYEYMSPSDTVDTEKKGKLSMRGSGILPAYTAAYQLGAADIFLIGVDGKSTNYA